MQNSKYPRRQLEGYLNDLGFDDDFLDTTPKI
jgi:hypothetical protein